MKLLTPKRLAEIRERTSAAIQYSLRTDSLWDEGNIDTWLDGMDFSEIELSYLKATAPATTIDLLDNITALESELEAADSSTQKLIGTVLKQQKLVTEAKATVTALKADLIAEERANCVSMDTEMKLKDTITALENEKTKLVKKWRDIVKRNEGTRDFSKRRAMNYLAACANELIEQEYK